MKKFLIIIGTRPEVIKMAPVYYELAKLAKVELCVTGQHKQMLKQALKIFDLIPDYDLKVMVPNQSLSSLNANLMKKIQVVIERSNPDCVIVHGDTSTCMSASLVAFYNQIKIAHVEAGLRTHDIFSPFPEELNRQIVSKLANFHFCPTFRNKKTLIKEGVKSSNILVTGNTVIDALKMTLSKLNGDKHTSARVTKILKNKVCFDFTIHPFILVTGHRRENFGTGFKDICIALKKISEEFPELKIVYPVHLNPNVIEPVNKYLGRLKNVILCEPLPYIEFTFLMQFCYLVITDSGGIQEEAPTLGKPVVVMREKTERVEALTAKTVILTGTDTIKIFNKVKTLISNRKAYNAFQKRKNPYGNGKAAQKIASFLAQN